LPIYAIADLHLGLAVEKPMSVFGSHWDSHTELLAANWRRMVKDGDTVLVPGDISWAMRIEEVLPDLLFLDKLPGQKILCRGNHDFWWSSLAKLERLCAQNQLTSLSFLQNNCLEVEPDVLVTGTRGWLLPDDPEFSAADEKIYLREAGRLELSLQAAAARRQPGQTLVTCFHYPPFSRNRAANLFTALLEQHQVDICVFGHVHGVKPGSMPAFNCAGARTYLVAADYLEFKPACIVSCT
jgi:predicted phosphohydrolase